MNDPLDDDAQLDAEARNARDAVRALPPAAADPAYRERLKADFASGAIERAGAAKPAPRPPIPFPWRGGRPTGGWRAAAAIAAAVIVVMTGGILNQGPMWRITGVRGAGTVLLDGTPVSAADPKALGRRVPAGVRIEVTDGAELDLRANGVLAMQCTAGTDLILPPSPPRWFARRTSLHVQKGEIRIATGPAFKGARLAVTTPDAEVAATGTTFAVILEPTGTCVCVYEGRVMVGPRDGLAAPIMGGNRRYVYRGGRRVKDASMRPSEHDKLSAFHEVQMAAMEGR